MPDNSLARGSLTDIIDDFGTKVGVFDDERVWQHKPVDVIQFLEDPRYMNFRYNKKLGVGLRPCIADDMVAIFGMDPERIAPIKREAYFSEAVGTGKSTKLAFICLYPTYKLLCLYNPLYQLQKLGAKIGANTKISIVMLSRTEENAKDVVFSKANAFVMQSQWFLENYLPAADIISKLVFDDFPKNRNKAVSGKIYKNISIVPGSSSEYSPLGKDVYVGIMDEITKFQAAQDRTLTDADTDQAEILYESLTSRITSRFGSAGLFVGVGNPEHKNDFIERHTEKVKDDPKIYVVKRRSLWDATMPEFDPEAKNADGTDTYPHFYFDTIKKRVIPDNFREKYHNKPEIIRIPYGPEESYYDKFKSNPEAAMRDLAGIPTEAVGHAYPDIGLYARNKNDERENPIEDIPQPDNPTKHIKSFFVREHLKWHGLHIDLAETGDAATFALSHPYKMDERNNPYIWLDMIYRFVPSHQAEFQIDTMQDFVEYLWKVKRIPIGKITADRHQSAQLLQTFQTWKLRAELLSVDLKSKEIFDNLVWTIREKRLNYFSHEVWFREMQGLEKDGPNRIVKPPHGSDDVAQAVAGSVWNSMQLALMDDPEGEIWDVDQPWEEIVSQALIV